MNKFEPWIFDELDMSIMQRCCHAGLFIAVGFIEFDVEFFVERVFENELVELVNNVRCSIGTVLSGGTIHVWLRSFAG